MDWILNSPSPSKIKSKTNKTSNNSFSNPTLRRLLLSPELLKPLSKWLILGLKIFYPLTKPHWKLARIEFGTGNPYETSEYHKWLLILGGFSNFKKIDLQPNWLKKELHFKLECSWNLFPAIILLKSLIYFLRFPYYRLIKSLYFASSKRRWKLRHKNMSKLDSLFNN